MAKGKFFSALLIVPLMFSCGGKKKVKTALGFDNFCNKYIQKEGLYACKCEIVASDEAVSLAKEETTAEARSELSRILESKVETMVKRYRERVKAGEKIHSGSTLEEVSRIVSKNYLRGSRIIEAKTFKLPDGRLGVCSVLGLEPVKIRMMIDEIARREKLSPKDEFILYEEFKSYKARQDLEKELFEYEH